MTILEAAALSRPIIMTNVGCAGEFLTNDKNGIVVPVRDVKAMATALSNLVSDKTYAHRLGQEAYRDALAFMSREENDRLMKKSWAGALRCQ